MVKIPVVSFLKERSIKGDLKKRSELMFRTLHYLETASFEDEDIKQFLIQAFKSICEGEDANKALLLKGNVSGKVQRKDFLLVHEIGEEISDCHSVLTDGKTKNRKRKTPLNDCIEEASAKHNISYDTAKAYYKEYKSFQKILENTN